MSRASSFRPRCAYASAREKTKEGLCRLRRCEIHARFRVRLVNFATRKLYTWIIRDKTLLTGGFVKFYNARCISDVRNDVAMIATIAHKCIYHSCIIYSHDLQYSLTFRKIKMYRVKESLRPRLKCPGAFLSAFKFIVI